MALIAGAALAAFLTHVYFSGHYDDFFSKGRDEPTVPDVTTLALIQISEIPLIVPGKVDTGQKGVITSPFDARVEWTAPGLRPGGKFNRDELLLRLDASSYRLIMAEKQVELEQARADAASEHLDSINNIRKYDSGIGSQGAESDLVLRFSHRRLVDAKIAAAQEALKDASRSVELADVKSPYSCVVTSVHVEQGRTLRKGDVICEIEHSDRRRVLLPLSSCLLPLISAGEQGDIPIAIKAVSQTSGHSWSGRAACLNTELNPQTLDATLIVDLLPNENNPWSLIAAPVNLPLDVHLVIKLASPVYMIPASAVGADSAIWVIGSDGKLAKRNIDIAGSLPGCVLIGTDGVREGDILCLSVSGTPREGCPVFLPESTPGRQPSP